MSIIDYLDLIIIVCIAFLVYHFFKRTDAFKIILGLFIIYLVYIVFNMFEFEKTTYILRKTFEISWFGLIVIFHQELRTMLRKIGGLADTHREKYEAVEEIQKAAYRLSQQKTGALIIFDQKKTLSFQMEDMTKIDATCTSELIETIFHNNTPLHDGAVIIQDDKIAYAGCKLPLSGKKRKELGHLGTRHTAAVETAEVFDVIAVVVSEESGTVSIANSNGLTIVQNQDKFKSFFRKENEKKTLFKRKVKKDRN